MKNNSNINGSLELPKQKYRILSGYNLKILGIILMIIDHIHQMFYIYGAPVWFNMIGRACMPIFLFMSAEGFYYTKSRKKYMLRLLIGFWFMNIMNLLIELQFPLENVALMNNVFGTMLLAVFYMWMTDMVRKGFKEKSFKKIILGIGGTLLPFLAYILMTAAISADLITAAKVIVIAVPTIFTVEGGWSAVLLAVLFYWLRKNRWVQLIPLVVLSVLSARSGGYQWMMVFAIIPIILYNGRQGRKDKYFFYIFYPAHIYLFYIVSYFYSLR
jgi:hypothetical protein